MTEKKKKKVEFLNEDTGNSESAADEYLDEEFEEES